MTRARSRTCRSAPRDRTPSNLSNGSTKAPKTGTGESVPAATSACCRPRTASPIVAFRNADGGHRDIWLTRARHDGKAGFEPAVPVTPDAWSFDGCPHDGPALGLIDETLHILWMDAHAGKNRVYAAGSAISSWQFAAAPGESPGGRQSGASQAGGRRTQAFRRLGRGPQRSRARAGIVTIGREEGARPSPRSRSLGRRTGDHAGGLHRGWCGLLAAACGRASGWSLSAQPGAGRCGGRNNPDRLERGSTLRASASSSRGSNPTRVRIPWSNGTTYEPPRSHRPEAPDESRSQARGARRCGGPRGAIGRVGHGCAVRGPECHGRSPARGVPSFGRGLARTVALSGPLPAMPRN